MAPKKNPAVAKKKASPKTSPTHRTGPWVIGARDKIIPADTKVASPSKEQVDPAYDPVLFAISTPPSSRCSSPARSPKQPREAGDPEAYDFHRLVKARTQNSPPPEGITPAMISEDAKARASPPTRTVTTSAAASSTLGLTPEQLMAHEAARLNDPYHDLANTVPLEALSESQSGGGVPPAELPPTHKTVRFADTINVDTPSTFDPNAEDTGTALPARSCRPATVPRYNGVGLYVPHPDSAP